MICGTRVVYTREVEWRDNGVWAAAAAGQTAQETLLGRLPLLWHNSTDSGAVFDIVGWMPLPWKVAVFLVASWKNISAFAISTASEFSCNWPY